MMASEGRKQPSCSLMTLYYGVFRCRSILPRRNSDTSSTTHSTSTSATAAEIPAPNLKKRRKVRFEEPTALVSYTDPNAQAPSTEKYSGSRKPSVRPPTTKSVSGRCGATAEGGGRTLLRASSSNVMLNGNLGNIVAAGTSSPNRNVLDYLPKTAKERRMEVKGRKPHKSGGANPVMGNIMKGGGEEQASVLCRELSLRPEPETVRPEPETVKEMGNVEYKKGRFKEALALYDRAVAMDPRKAAYWSNRAAALAGMGRLLEAVDQCREAVSIEPSYRRAHHRLATLYLRLGDAVKAMHHYQLSGNESSSRDFKEARALKSHLNRIDEARKRKDWPTVLKQSRLAIYAGADSAPQVFAAQAEALLKLQKHQEADKALMEAPAFAVDDAARFFGAPTTAYHLVVRAQVDMASGRFDEAVSDAEKAVQLDPNNKETAALARRIRAAAAARSKGNCFFNASKFKEACAAYQDGLQLDPHNSILLCNRAACRSKLGRWQEAVEDCDMALDLRPSYGKARLRRADCNVKLGRWKEAIQDYEVLVQESPGDEDVRKALWEARIHLMKEPRA